MNVTNNEVTTLVKDIDITRRARINSEQRLLLYSSLFKFLLPYYSVFSLGLAIYLYKNPASSSLDFLGIILSILILVFSLLITTLNFNYRAEKYRECYIKLKVLLSKFQTLKSGNEYEIAREEFISYSNEYQENLALSENHKPIDYYKLQAMGNYPGTPWKRHQAIYYFRTLILWVFVIILFLIPLIVLFKSYQP